MIKIRIFWKITIYNQYKEEDVKNTGNEPGNKNDSLSVSLKNKNRRIAYVPNNEIRFALIDIVKHQNWYKRMKIIRRSETLLRAIRELDGDKTAEIIQEIHNSSAVSRTTTMMRKL